MNVDSKFAKNVLLVSSTRERWNWPDLSCTFWRMWGSQLLRASAGSSCPKCCSNLQQEHFELTVQVTINNARRWKKMRTINPQIISSFLFGSCSKICKVIELNWIDLLSIVWNDIIRWVKVNVSLQAPFKLTLAADVLSRLRIFFPEKLSNCLKLSFFI